MAIAVTFDLHIIPERLSEFLESLKAIAPETRAYDGCVLFDIWVDQEKPGKVLFYEIWESRAKQEKYLAWRVETGLLEALAPFMAAETVISYLDKVDA
ncbi:MAG: antibiotic biosynthesis monooxygenase [Litoreibacter sp.]